MSGAGGYRPGAGRKRAGRPPGASSSETRAERSMYARILAAYARDERERQLRTRRRLRCEGRSSDELPAAPPAVPRDDVEAATAFCVRLLLRAIADGSDRAAIHLDERLHGRVKYTLEHGGIDGGEPIQHSVTGRIYTCELSDGSATFAPKSPAVPGRVPPK